MKRKEEKMSIKEAHRILSNGLVNAPSEHEWCEAFKLAIDNLEKYQKMQEVLDRISRVPAFMVDSEQALKEIIQTYKEVR